jgi:predicted dinucleotide-binding enzyme
METDVALVTGAAGDIGAAIAGRLAARGVRVVLADRDLDGARHAAARLPGSSAIALDLRSPESVRAVAQLHGPLRYLVNNAAVCANVDYESIDEPTWSADLDVVLAGSIRMCQAVLPAMRRAGRGAVVNVASVNGHGYFGNDVYSAAKAGLLSLTRSLRALVPAAPGRDAAGRRARGGLPPVRPGGVDHRHGPAGRRGPPGRQHPPRRRHRCGARLTTGQPAAKPEADAGYRPVSHEPGPTRFR